MYATWLAFTSTVLALARFAIMPSWSGLIDRSTVATIYQVGLVFQAGDVRRFGAPAPFMGHKKMATTKSMRERPQPGGPQKRQRVTVGTSLRLSKADMTQLLVVL